MVNALQLNTADSLNGFDISHYQGEPSLYYSSVYKSFMFHRISSFSTGTYHKDNKFKVNIENARTLGIPCGGYIFCGINTGTFAEAENQADTFINDLQEAFGTNHFGDIFPVLDFELISKLDPNLTTDRMLEWVEHFCDYFYAQTDRHVMIYTSQYFLHWKMISNIHPEDIFCPNIHYGLHIIIHKIPDMIDHQISEDGQRGEFGNIRQPEQSKE